MTSPHWFHPLRSFFLQESRFGQLTYMRIYQGTMRRGDIFYNVDKKERMKVGRLGDRGESGSIANVKLHHYNTSLK